MGSDLCQICKEKSAIYTCPRCGFHTCSMKCSQSHKIDGPCSGERDKTAYVPMNKYDWGTMTSDYTYLEEVGRKTTEWGGHILKDGLLSRPRPGSRGRVGNSIGKKKESLRLQLQARGIDMETLPAGMEKSKLNKSFYDAKTKSILMSIEILIHPPTSTVVYNNPPIRILSHKNKLLSTLDNAVSKGLRDHVGRTKHVDPWLAEFAKQHDRNILVFLMAQTSELLLFGSVKVYHKLDPCATLQNILKLKTFVEYPTIEIWQDGDFSGVVKEESGKILDVKARWPKSSTTDNRADKETITSLLQDYTSQDEEDKQDSILGLLGRYNSDNEPFDESVVEEDTEDEMDDDGLPSEGDIRATLVALLPDNLEQSDEPLSDDDDERDCKDSEDEESIILKVQAEGDNVENDRSI